MKWVHIIGIAGVTTSGLALEFKNHGWKVTGSDEKVYPPASDKLKNAGIEYFEDFSFKHLLDEYGNMPDLVVLGSSKSSKNKELLFAQKQKLTIKTYPEILKEKVIVSHNSIVVTGTFGKTSITCMLAYLFSKYGEKVSYMFGGFSDSLTKTLKFKDEHTRFSIIEGDEYINSHLDKRSKFFYYLPRFLVINSVEWDHTDVFKTEAEYVNNFKKLVNEVPAGGIIFANNSKNIDEVISQARCKVIRFDFENYKVENKNIIGRFNKENLAFAAQIGESLGLEKEKVKEILSQFKGIKRRLEIRYSDNQNIIIDDFGSSPAKAVNSIEVIKNEFPGSKLTVIFEPNEGARTQEAIELYEHVFDEADKVYFPAFREIPGRLDASNLKSQIPNTQKIKLMSSINEIDIESSKSNVFAFLGSHDFEEKISSLKSKLQIANSKQ